MWPSCAHDVVELTLSIASPMQLPESSILISFSQAALALTTDLLLCDISQSWIWEMNDFRLRLKFLPRRQSWWWRKRRKLSGYIMSYLKITGEMRAWQVMFAWQGYKARENIIIINVLKAGNSLSFQKGSKTEGGNRWLSVKGPNVKAEVNLN